MVNRLVVVAGGGTYPELKGRVPTPFGPIDARWERRDGGIGYAIRVPEGTTCVIKGVSYGPGVHNL